MPTCTHCHQPQTAALVICPECYWALTERTDSMDEKMLIEALIGCMGRMDCRKCPIFGRCNGTFDSALHVTVKYIKAQATENATLRAQLEEMTQRNDENSGACKIFARRLAEKDKQLAAAVERQAELEDALRDMILQYCSYDGKLDHEFMSAGENAFGVLDLEYGAPTETLWRGPQEAGEVEHGN